MPSEELIAARRRIGLDTTNGHGAQVAYLPRFTEDLATSGGFSRWLKENSARAVPVWVLEQLFDIIGEQVLRINELETANAALLARVTGLEAAAINTKAATGGWSVYESGKRYSATEMVTRKGGLWLCTADTADAPGMNPSAWKLVLREGKVTP